MRYLCFFYNFYKFSAIFSGKKNLLRKFSDISFFSFVSDCGPLSGQVFMFVILIIWGCGGAAGLGTALQAGRSWGSGGRRFGFRWCHWKFSLTQPFRPHYGPGVNSASDRNECQEYSPGVGAG